MTKLISQMKEVTINSLDINRPSNVNEIDALLGFVTSLESINITMFNTKKSKKMLIEYINNKGVEYEIIKNFLTTIDLLLHSDDELTLLKWINVRLSKLNSVSLDIGMLKSFWDINENNNSALLRTAFVVKMSISVFADRKVLEEYILKEKIKKDNK